jgi:hypothetical protein
MLRYAVPPGYQRQQPVKRPKLGPWLSAIDAILEEDKRRPAKQRHTAKRIFERLRTEYAFSGGYTIVKDYVRTQRLRSRRCSCRWCMLRAKRRRTSARRWWWSPEWSGRRTTWRWTCHTPMKDS